MGWDTWANALEKSGILRISPETYTSAKVAHYSVNVPSFSEDDNIPVQHTSMFEIY